jgi:hypothetical protein
MPRLHSLQFPVQLKISCQPRNLSLGSREILQYSPHYYSYCRALQKLGKTQPTTIRVSNIFRNGFFLLNLSTLFFGNVLVWMRVPNKRSCPGDSWKNEFIFVTLKIHRVLLILSCGVLAAPPWGLDILKNTTWLRAKVPWKSALMILSWAKK